MSQSNKLFEALGKVFFGTLLLMLFLPMMTLLPAYWVMLGAGVAHRWWPVVPLASFGETWLVLVGLTFLIGAFRTPIRVDSNGKKN